ncbi:MAG: hypothetical protein ACTSQE_11730 [Candidatus Heimdallarchaeaceae archaeon]
MNTLLIIGILFVFYSFIYFKTNTMHPIVNIASFIGGALVFAFIVPNFTVVEYNSIIDAWGAKYDIWISLLIIPLLIFFLFSFIIPILSKLMKTEEKNIKKQIMIQILGFTVIIIWAIIAGFTSNPLLRSIRPFLLPSGWFLWSLTLLIDPFNLMVSNAKVSQLLITTSNGLPVYYKDFTSHSEDEIDEEISSDLASGLIAGVAHTLEQIIEQKSKLSTVVYKDKVIGITSVGYLQAFVFGKRFDKALETVLNVLLNEIQESQSFGLNITPDYVDIDNTSRKILSLMVEQTLKRILVI